MATIESVTAGLDSHARILLIEPPFYRFFGYERWHYPITLTLIGTYLNELGYHVQIYDADKPSPDCKSLNRLGVINNYPLYEQSLQNPDHPVWREVYQTIEQIKPDVIGLTSITAKIDSASIVAGMAREILGDKVKIVLGGPHVQGMRVADPDHDFGPVYDYIVTRIPDVIRLKPNKTLIIGHNTYSAANFSGILTASGCPNTCTFCCHSFEKSMIYRDIGKIREEIVEIRAAFHGEAPVYIMDDCFFSNSRHFHGVIKELKTNGLAFTAGARIMALTREKIATFVQNGGIKILVGVESGSQRILDKVEKRLKIQDIIARTQWLHDAGIPWSAFFVVGFPFETLDDLKLTEELIDTIQPTFVSLNRFTPYPGTRIYTDYYKNSKLPFRDLFQLNRNSGVKFNPEIEDYIDRLFVHIDSYNSTKKQLFP